MAAEQESFRIVDHAGFLRQPEWFTLAILGAMKKLDLPHDKVNVHGGACALGHPVGASGARLRVTLLAALQKYELRRGVVSLCIGTGEAVALAVELI